MAGGWRVTHRWATFRPTALAWPAPSVAYALGAGGLARSTDSGRTWVQVFPALAPTAGIAAAGATTAYGVQDATDQGALLASADGGAQWGVRGDLPAALTGVRFVSAREGFAVGAAWIAARNRPSWQLYAAADGGRSWALRSTLPVAAREQVNGLWMAGPRRGLMLVSSGYIWPQIGGGVAPVVLWQTLDGGRTWAKLRAVPLPPLGTLGAASFLAARAEWTGWLADSSGLSATDDSGRTWRLISGAPSLDGVDLVSPSFGVGWSGPTNGRIRLWRTADGGRHWSRLPLPAALTGDASLAGANGSQVPVSASFISPSVGWLIADGATWRTTDGGRNWSAAGA